MDELSWGTVVFRVYCAKAMESNEPGLLLIIGHLSKMVLERSSVGCLSFCNWQEGLRKPISSVLGIVTEQGQFHD